MRTSAAVRTHADFRLSLVFLFLRDVVLPKAKSVFTAHPGSCLDHPASLRPLDRESTATAELSIVPGALTDYGRVRTTPRLADWSTSPVHLYTKHVLSRTSTTLLFFLFEVYDVGLSTITGDQNK